LVHTKTEMCVLLFRGSAVLYSCRDDPCAESVQRSKSRTTRSQWHRSKQPEQQKPQRCQAPAGRIGGKSAHVVAQLPRGPLPRRPPVTEPNDWTEPWAWEYRVHVPVPEAQLARAWRFCFYSYRFPLARRRVAQIMPRTWPTCKGYSYNSSLQARRPHRTRALFRPVCFGC
jgi:hypothetical protein